MFKQIWVKPFTIFTISSGARVILSINGTNIMTSRVSPGRDRFRITRCHSQGWKIPGCQSKKFLVQTYIANMVPSPLPKEMKPKNPQLPWIVEDLVKMCVWECLQNCFVKDMPWYNVASFWKDQNLDSLQVWTCTGPDWTAACAERHPKEWRNGNGGSRPKRGLRKDLFFLNDSTRASVLPIVLQVYQSCYKNGPRDYPMAHSDTEVYLWTYDQKAPSRGLA